LTVAAPAERTHPSAPAYPPPPWELHGQAHFHVVAVPAAELPRVPDGFRALVLGGRGIAIVGWVDYQSGSILRYGELVAAVLGRWSGGLAFTVTHMWVDSPESRAGGRELWGYPKELAEFSLAINPSGPAGAHDERGTLASGAFRSLVSLPRVRVTAGTVQPVNGRLTAIRAVFRGRPAVGRGAFVAPPSSPLAFVTRSRRVLSIGLRDFHFTFGETGG
jgi:hypothetical protein